VLRGLATAFGVEPPVSATARRALWERIGVQTDSVSSTCLTVGVRDGLAHRTHWDLQRSPLRITSGAVVLVCENPRVLEAAADELTTPSSARRPRVSAIVKVMRVDHPVSPCC
jgi:hypothetical protein